MPNASIRNQIVYALTERDGRTYWTRIGTAFRNRDGSTTCKLDALPVSGALQLRDDEPQDDLDRGGERDRKERR